MSFLPEVYQRNRKPLLEGRGVKVFRLGELRQQKNLSAFLIKEGWGPEDILQDMMEDKGIRRLVKDIMKALKRGKSLDRIAANIQHYEDAASTRLTTEERTVLLKSLEKKIAKKQRKQADVGLRYGHEERTEPHVTF